MELNNNIINNKKSDTNLNNEFLQMNLINIKNEKYANNSFSDLSLSDIGNKDKNSIPSQRSHYKNNENEKINNFILNEIEKRSSLESIKYEDLNNLFFIKNKKKLTKEDLNNIPLPIFSCIYCSNEKLSFNHFSNEILSNNYSLMTSIYDIKELNKIFSNKYLIDKDDKNDKLENIIIQNTEYINKYYTLDEIRKILIQTHDDKNYFEIYQKQYIQKISNILNKIKIKKIQNNLIKIPSITKKISQYHSFNNNKINNIINNSTITNSTDRLNELHFNNNNKKNNPNFNQTISNLSVSSFINYIDNNFLKEKENRFKLDDIIEQIEKNSNIEYSGFDLSRKIKREDIDWENGYYNIWSPIIDPISSYYIPVSKNKTINKKINKTFIKLQKGNNLFYTKIKENISPIIINKRCIHLKGKEKLNINKSYQKNEFSKKKLNDIEISSNNIKILKKNAITHLITNNSPTKNIKNILINLNDNTPNLKNIKKNKNNISTHTENNNSQKYLKPITTSISLISLNIKKKVNVNPINLFKSSKNISKFKYYQINNPQLPLNINKVNNSINLQKKTKIKIESGKSFNKNKNNQKKKTSRNKINTNFPILSFNTSINKKKCKKIKNINSLPKLINNELKKKQINLTNIIQRNNTLNIKEKSVIINISDYCYDSNLNLFKNDKNNKNKSKIKKQSNKNNNINNSKNKNDKNKKIINKIKTVKSVSGKNKPTINNTIENKKKIYDIKIISKKILK